MDRHAKAPAGFPRNHVTRRDIDRLALESFDSMPEQAVVRVQVVAALRGCCVATVWRHTREGLLPQPEKFGRVTGWRVGALRQAMAPAKA